MPHPLLDWENEGGAEDPVPASRDELRHKLDREIAVSRALAIKLEEMTTDRDVWRCKARNMATSFMGLHNFAKDIVGPRP